ncbi:MAG TPA: mandelate racemase/muconate lactonizing enzyme family protein [Burkholderiales bacterium]|nr:mandelate racemase/muconate lactonizing enzyme family protein [Burkholderiales bacterium]
MKITRLETLRLSEFPNLVWVRVHTDEGLAGLGETSYAAQSVEAYLHEYIAPRVLGRDPLEIEALTRSLAGYLGWRGSGVETRAVSAFDIALWDLYGKVCGQPLYQVLGGAARQSIRTYNTCAGYRYIRAAGGQNTKNWGLDGKAQGPYEDLDAFLHRADELAQSLLEQGITGMKIWPFDPAAETTDGQYISPEDLQKSLEPFRRIRSAVGSRMDIMVEFHSLWRVLPAQRIAQALAEFDTFWHEDPIRMDSLALLKQYAPHSKAPICASEILAGRWSFKDLLETGVAGIVMFDLAWCGGISEARRIAALADAWQLPVAPHDCTGPVVYAASVHFSIHALNALIQESVRAFYTGWYNELVTHVPQPVRGCFEKPPGPGIGCELLPELWKRKDASVRASPA